jgi:hypothetical protein
MSLSVTAAITAQNTFTDPLRIAGWFSVSISGTFAANVTVQRSVDGSTWRDVNTFTAPFEGTGVEPDVMYYRVGVKTGQYTSGTADIRFSNNAEFRS